MGQPGLATEASWAIWPEGRGFLYFFVCLTFLFIILPLFLNIVFLAISNGYNIQMYVDIFQSVDLLILLRM